ncbi:MAG: hypothetical protein ACTHKG_11380 [Nocardioides sp.]
MNPAAATRLTAERLALAGRQQLALRGAAGAASVGMIVLASVAGGGFHPILSTVLLLLTLLAMLVPDSAAPMFLVLGLGGLWGVYVPETLSAWTLVAAADLLVLHLACTLASYGPPQLSLEPAMFRLWAGRGLVLLAVTALVWVGARVLGGLGLEPSGLVTAAALGLLLAWLVWLSVRLIARDGT